jgi:anti-anti-sigma factor
MNVPHFKIEERQESGGRRLVLIGELDIAAGPMLEARLDQLRAGQPASTSCGQVTPRYGWTSRSWSFMDSSGLQLLLKRVKHARENGSSLQIDRETAAAVKRVIELSGVARLLGGDGGGAD